MELSSQPNPIKTVLLILVFYIIPPLAIVANLIPYQYRFIVLMGITPVMMLIKPDGVTSLTDLGVTTTKLRQSMLAIMPMTIAMALPMVILASTSTAPRIDNSDLPLGFYIFYIVISCPLQEFGYRGYLFRLMHLLGLSKWSRIVVGALLYSFVHIIYQDIWTLVFTLIAGLLWNIHYEKFRNLASVTFSHMILGTATILLGFI